MNEQYNELKETVEGQREEMNAKFEENNENLKQIECKMENFNKELRENLEGKIELVNNTSVSYTHLDVYKRQGRSRHLSVIRCHRHTTSWLGKMTEYVNIQK